MDIDGVDLEKYPRDLLINMYSLMVTALMHAE